MTTYKTPSTQFGESKDVEFIDLDLSQCPCEEDCGKCQLYPAERGCYYGVCTCLLDAKIEMVDGRCEDPVGKTTWFHETTTVAGVSPNVSRLVPGVNMACPVRCECGCDEHLEKCVDNKCYCIENGKEVMPIVMVKQDGIMYTPHGEHAAKYSQCPQPKLILYPTVITCAVFTVLIVFCLVLTKLYRKRRPNNNNTNTTTNHEPRRISSQNSTSIRIDDHEIRPIVNAFYLESSDVRNIKELLLEIDLSKILSENTMTFLKEKTLDPSTIKRMDEIGHGHFGKVYKGHLTSANCNVIDIAIKTPNLSCIDKTRLEGELKDFYTEAKLTSKFCHKNILSCLGISKGPDDIPWLIFEFMPFGDLLEVLRSNCGLASLHKKNLPLLSKKDMWYLSFQIATGMSYLSSQWFTHRDLAARNCLIGKDLQLKISDFGLTRDVYTDEYYKMGEHRLVPVRWMAPESIERRVFSSESDVFSYGIVLWEIYTFGKTPYYGLDNHEVSHMVPEGLRLTPPEGCPEAMQELMQLCWKPEPSERITFEMICHKLSNPDGQMNQFINPSYDSTFPVVQTPKISPYIDVLPD